MQGALEGIRIERCSSAGLWVDVLKLDPIPPLVVSDAKYGISVAARNVGTMNITPSSSATTAYSACVTPNSGGARLTPTSAVT